MAALLIKNVKLLGSTKKYPEKVDIFVSGEKISAIGNFPNKSADEVIDGQGCFASAGFIDINTDSDHYLTLFTDPDQGDFLRQGVTTIIGGHCGASLAPLIYGSLEAIQKWTDPHQINVDWHSMAEFLDMFSRKPLGLNFGTLVGHSTIRRALVGDILRDLTQNEVIVFGESLKRALREGGLGFSTGLSYVHARQAPYQEIKYLVEIVKQFDALYTTHLRKSGSEIDESVSETIRITQETGVKTVISHFMPVLGAEESYERAMNSIEALPESVSLNFDVYPFDASLLPLYTFLPLWAQNGGRDVMLQNINDPWLMPRLKKDFPEIADVHGFIVAHAPRNDSLVGRSLRDLIDIYEVRDAREALLQLMISTKLQATILYRNLNTELIKRALVHPRSLVASNAASVPEAIRRKMIKSDRATKTFPYFLNLVLENNIMPLEEAIKKITQLPAKLLGIKGRGAIEEGNFADIVGFRGGEIKFTIVNGSVAMKDGEITGVRQGKVIKRT